MMQRADATRLLEGTSDRAASREGREPARDNYLLAVALIAILAVWIWPLSSSLWLDETGTFWVIQGSLSDVFDRALDFQGQFPLYHSFLWGWSKLAGTSELALRLPSLFGALLATWLCYRLALRLFKDVDVARLAACIFVLLHPVAFAAADARPYALALAALLAATLALVRWLQSRRLLDGIVYVGLTALTLYLHYLFVLALIAHAVLAYGQVRRLGRRGVVAAAGAVGALALLLLPAIPHFIEVLGRRRAMSLFTFGSVPELLAWVAPPMVVVAFLVGRHVNLPDDPAKPRKSELRRDLLMGLGVWLVLPPLTLFVAGQVSGIGLYAERHFLSAVPALALLAASAFALLSARRRRIAVVVLAMLFVLSYSKPFNTSNDWQGAAQAANAVSDDPETPVLVYTGFSESREMDWILDDQRSQLFLAPLAAYPVNGRKYPLPYELTDRAKEYVEAIVASEAPDTDRIILMTSELTLTYDVWLADLTSPFGYTRKDVGDFGGVRVLVFER
jgi:dolichyl-phosphate-mannose-protein mannosyltransferase